ncbi:MAG: sporulation protein YqfD [Bacillota bacterium]|nr:sporulation protein YqfD [Bacillota bacterium]
MLVLRLIRWLKGYVLFKAYGKFPERFINLTIREGIPLWNVVGGKCELSATCSLNDYMHIRPIARKACVRLKNYEKHGLPFVIKKHRRRKGILLGIMCFFIIIKILSMHVWTVEINGIDQLSETTVRQSLAQMGLYEGASIKSINVPRIERDITLKLPEISWVSVNIIGSSAKININERVIHQDIIPAEKPCNVKATFDGQITAMQVLTGKSTVAIGDAVVKGQLLISGVVEDNVGNLSVKHADGKIFAKTTRSTTIVVPLKQTLTLPTGKSIARKRADILLFHFPIDCAYVPFSKCYAQDNESCVNISGNRLPISVLTENSYEYTNQDVIYNKNQATKVAIEKLALYESFFMNDKTILNRNIATEIKNNTLIMNVRYTCEENIASQQPFNISEIKIPEPKKKKN